MRTRKVHTMNTVIARGRAGAAVVRERPGVRLAGLLALAFALVAAFMMSASPANAEDEDDYSLYNLSSSVSTYFGNSMSPDDDSDPMTEGWSDVVGNPANGGSVLGYSDPDLSEGLLKWATSSLSGSSGTIGYAMFNNIAVEGESSGASGVEEYAYYGATLQGLGLDSTSSAWSGSMTAMLGGGLIFTLFCTSALADMIFAWMFTLLDFLNPFRLFYEGVAAINQTFADGMTGGKGLGGPLAGLGEWIGGWYEVLVNLSWAVLVPLMLGMFLISLFLLGQSNRGGRAKRLVIRVVFLGLGLPLLGGTYSATIDAMQDMTAGGSTGATKVVLSTYVDFNAWAKNGRLAVPEDCATIEWDKAAGQPSAESMANVRNTALCVNGLSNKYGELTSIIGAGADTSWSSEVMKSDDSEIGEDGLPGGNTAGSFSNLTNVMVLMGNYMAGQTVSASDFETSIKGNISQVVRKADEGDIEDSSGTPISKNISAWFLNYDKPSDLGNDDLSPAPGSHPLISVPADSGLRAENKSGMLTFSTAEGTITGLGFMAVSTNPSKLGSAIEANLSPLAMYNYLNTDFDASGLTTYSSEKATSGAVRESHNMVSQVGTGTMSFLYWLNSVVLLAAFSIIGIGYALVMIFAAVRRMIQLISAVPFATIGAIPGIAKVVIYSISLILEVVVTAFCYVLVQNVLMSLPQIIEVPLSTFLNTDGGAVGLIAFLVNRNALAMVITIVSIVTIVWFTILAMRIRKTLMKAIDEAVTKIVDKFMETAIAPPSRGSGLGQKMGNAASAGAGALAGGAGAGLGMAAASNLMGNQGGGKSKSPGAGGKGKFGPGGIGSSGIPGGPNGGGGIGGLAPGVNGAMGMLGGGQGDGGPNDPNDPNGPNGGDGGQGNDGVNLGGSVSDLSGGSDPRDDREIAEEVRAQGGLQGSGDALDSMSNTAEHDAEGYKAKDLKGVEQAGEAGKGIVKAGEAVGRGVAGDYVGAAGAGLGALESGQKVQDMENEKKDIQAGIDGPTPGNEPGTAGGTVGAGDSDGDQGGFTPGEGSTSLGGPGADGGSASAGIGAGDIGGGNLAPGVGAAPADAPSTGGAGSAGSPSSAPLGGGDTGGNLPGGVSAIGGTGGSVPTGGADKLASGIGGGSTTSAAIGGLGTAASAASALGKSGGADVAKSGVKSAGTGAVKPGSNSAASSGGKHAASAGTESRGAAPSQGAGQQQAKKPSGVQSQQQNQAAGGAQRRQQPSQGNQQTQRRQAPGGSQQAQQAQRQSQAKAQAAQQSAKAQQAQVSARNQQAQAQAKTKAAQQAQRQAQVKSQQAQQSKSQASARAQSQVRNQQAQATAAKNQAQTRAQAQTQQARAQAQRQAQATQRQAQARAQSQAQQAKNAARSTGGARAQAKAQANNRARVAEANARTAAARSEQKADRVRAEQAKAARTRRKSELNVRKARAAKRAADVAAAKARRSKR